MPFLRRELAHDKPVEQNEKNLKRICTRNPRSVQFKRGAPRRGTECATRLNLTIGYRKKPDFSGLSSDVIGRGEWIRTTDPSVPNRVLYQAEPRPDTKRERLFYLNLGRQR